MANDKKFVAKNGLQTENNILVNTAGVDNGVDNVQVNGSILTDSTKFETTAGVNVSTGEVSWNADEGTLDVGLLNNSVNQVGQEVSFFVKNQTGSLIPDGTAVMATGTLGASGKITIAPMVADGSVLSRYFLGITTHDIADGADGYVTHFGKIRGIDTSTWNNGDVLWCDPLNSGGLVNDEPTGASLKLAVAFVIYSAANGTMFVRATQGSNLHESNDISIINLTDDDILKYDGENSVWINSTETDPVFTASASSSITSTNITNWNTAYGWGDHGIEGYLTAETDPLFTASASSGIVAGDITNWNTAYGWGDHGIVGYLTVETDTLDSVTGRGATTTNNITANSFITSGGTSSDFVKGDGTLDSSTYLTAETDTLDSVTGRGATTTNNISVGDLSLNQLNLKTDYALPPTYSEGKVFYDSEYKTLTIYNEQSDMSLQVGQQDIVRVYNNSGSTINKGTPCRPNGSNGENPSVSPADASTQGLARVLGVASHDILNNTVGYLTQRGMVSGIDTSGLMSGKPVWLSPTGGLTSQAPTYPYYPTQIGGCVLQDGTDGYLFVEPSYYTQDQLRVVYNGHIDGNLTVDGNMTVNGTQSITNQQNLAINDSFIYLNSGDNIGEDGTTFSGTGLNDAYFVGYYEGTTSQTYYVRIDSVGGGTGGVDTFEWSKDNFSTTEATGIDIDGTYQALENELSIYFNATTGHTLNDTWSGTAIPINIDTGWATNRNTGTSGIGYTHMGVFFDVSDEKFKFFDEYAPEPSGTIDVNDASFSLGTIVANTFEGDLVGNADTATSATTLINLTTTVTELNYVNGVTSAIQTQLDSKLENVVEDTTPQLGGNLDANGNDINMGTNTITDTKVGNWDTAFGWGDHSTQGYLIDITSENIESLNNVVITSPANGEVLKYNGSNWVNGADDSGTGGGITEGQAIAFSLIFG